MEKDSSEESQHQTKPDSSEELNVICAKLCSLMKAQLVKSHDEVMSRYGGQAANFTGKYIDFGKIKKTCFFYRELQADPKSCNCC